MVEHSGSWDKPLSQPLVLQSCPLLPRSSSTRSDACEGDWVGQLAGSCSDFERGVSQAGDCCPWGRTRGTFVGQWAADRLVAKPRSARPLGEEGGEGFTHDDQGETGPTLPKWAGGPFVVENFQKSPSPAFCVKLLSKRGTQMRPKHQKTNIFFRKLLNIRKSSKVLKRLPRFVCISHTTFPAVGV